MKRLMFAAVALTLACRGAESGPDVPLDARWALSLKNLQAEARRHQELGTPPSTTVSQLDGINRVVALLFVDDDILLAGERDEESPTLELDDLVVALRNALTTDPDYAGVIGCTIDPRPGEDPWVLQDVTVFGGPRHSATASLHVRADYELKRVGAGLTQMPGVVGQFDRPWPSPCSDTGSHSAAHRYWFTPLAPRSPRYVEANDGAVWIQKPIHVQLKTEEEFLNGRGERLGSREARPAATEFARQVTALLATNDDLTAARMRQSFRTIEIAKLMSRRVEAAAILRHLLFDYALKEYDVPTRVNGVVRDMEEMVDCGSTTKRVGTELVTTKQTSLLSRKYRGGVEARIELESEHFTADRRQELRELRERILASRPSPDALSWEVYR